MDPKTGAPAPFAIYAVGGGTKFYLTVKSDHSGCYVTSTWDSNYATWFQGTYSGGTYFQWSNPDLNLVIATNDGQPATYNNPVMMISGSGDLTWIWNIIGNLEQPGYSAIQLASNTSLNLNVESGTDQPWERAEVCTWSWGGGNPNELWRIVPVNPPLT
ncbi:hypothetical protein [Deinococcus sp. Leaf326]|uniref:hypothetical protein n=1 Tax=Deinococcus sp. Leaf326 TaxID=1736338 RepID=UPI000AA25085|nr:hypothetical protein [Deinococcus sp. Leaf326]